MILRICTFTAKGRALCDRVIASCPDLMIEVKTKEEKTDAWTKECFDRRLPILFIGAAGIAVRTIAPFIKDKLSDSPVLVMDEKGHFVIPILSGHVGGANELAGLLADRLNAAPVITTATDVNDLWSVDVFAVRNGLHIVNREGIRKVSAALLHGQTVRIKVEAGIALPEGDLPQGVVLADDDTPDCDVDVLIRRGEVREISCGDAENGRPQNDAPKSVDGKGAGSKHDTPLILETKELVLGMGCRRDKSYEELMEFLNRQGVLSMEDQLFALASVDVKAREKGLVGLAQYLRIPFYTYSTDALNDIEGDFSESEFVRAQIGVGNVCERAAVCAAGEGAYLVRRKCAEEGMTLAIAHRRAKITTWETRS